MRQRRLALGGIATGLSGHSTLVWPQLASRKAVIGVLSLGSRSNSMARVGDTAFEEALRGLGYVDGRNAVIERRSADGNLDQLAPLAEQLVGLRPDVLVAGSNPEILALRRQTTTIPIVMVTPADPVGAGHVDSLARPGGNVTGLTASVGMTVYGKRLELLKDLVPGLKRMAVLVETSSVPRSFVDDLEHKASTLGLTLAVNRVRTVEEFDAAFASIVSARVGALLVTGAGLVGQGAQRIIEFGLNQRMPTMYALKEMVHRGMLCSYGFNLVESYRRAAVFVDKILKGAKPSDLPVEQPVRFELVLNLKTARAIGLMIPQSVLLRADEVIE